MTDANNIDIEASFLGILHSLKMDGEARDIVLPLIRMINEGIDEPGAAHVCSVIIEAVKWHAKSGRKGE